MVLSKLKTSALIFFEKTWRILIQAVILFALSTNATSADLPEDVETYLTYHLGRWESQTTYFDRDGDILRTETEGYGERALIPGQVNLHYSYNTEGSTNTAFRFYSHGDDRLYMIDVTHDGQWWVLSGERHTDIQQSEEKVLADGRRIILKVKHHNIRPSAFEATAELSTDGGATWWKFSHQDYRKIGDGFER